MRIASTTVVTSFEHESMMTLRLRSICINCRSVSSPSISGISTSRMMKSGRSPVPILSSASLPLVTVSTPKPSTSSRVCRYLRILGSSSTTRIFSLSAMFIPSWTRFASYVYALLGVDRQQKRKGAATSNHAIHPDLAPMRLNQALGDRQAQSHSRRRGIHPDEFFEYFLVKFGGDAVSGVGHRHQNAVVPFSSPPPPIFF